jgi:endonuclease/exonuclease/phosphatase family metal-dependent hydrolase
MFTRREFLTVSGSALAVAATTPLGAQVAGSDKPAEALDLMTYNLRYASATGANNWPSRRPLVAELLRREKPDVFGTQEGVYLQLRDIAADLPEYDWIGLGREGGSRGEFMAVYYRRDRLEPRSYDHFWLSDTPEVMNSSTWGHSNRRMLTSVQFLDLRTRKTFQFWNTHFDHQVELARQKASALVLQRIQKVDPAEPLILCGDFNAASGNSRSYEMLVKEGGLIDTWHAAKARSDADANSFNGFRPLKRESIRIDWILYRGSADVAHAAVIPWQSNGEWPSDHCPVTARLTWT